LFKTILDAGFDAEESDSGGIVVEARPGSRAVHDFNREACDADPFHATVVTGCIAYGSLSHSRLHQVLRNIRGGGYCIVPEVSESGKYSLAKLRSVDPPFARAAETGLLWEILSSAIEDEEPDGCAIIQAAMNAKKSMFLMRHEMQALAALVHYTAASAVAERALSLDAVRQKLIATCPEFAGDPNFLELYRFVIDLGSGAASFLPDLRSFHELFVDPKVRRIRLIDFAAVNQFPAEMPYLKVAGIKYAYACEARFVRHGFCKALSAKGIRDALSTAGLKALAGDADWLLDFFHRRCLPNGPAGGSASAVAGPASPAVAGKNNSMRTKFLGNLDADVFGILLKQLSVARRRAALVDSCGHAYLRMVFFFRGSASRRTRRLCLSRRRPGRMPRRRHPRSMSSCRQSSNSPTEDQRHSRPRSPKACDSNGSIGRAPCEQPKPPARLAKKLPDQPWLVLCRPSVVTTAVAVTMCTSCGAAG